MGKSKAGLLSITSTAACVKELSRIGVLFFPVTSLGIQHDLRLNAPTMAAITACKRRGSENRNILIRRDFSACSIASSNGCAVSSGRTIGNGTWRLPENTCGQPPFADLAIRVSYDEAFAVAASNCVR